MKFEELSLERYGSFSGRRLTFRPNAALHIVYGANEAGKTTALAAIGDLLFGFGQTTPFDFRHDQQTLRVGGKLRLTDGRDLLFRRRKGRKNTLVDQDDRPLPDDLLLPILGSIGRETFRTEFGLTSQALRDGGAELLKAGGRLAETLAAGSAGLSSLSRLRERLAGEADALFGMRRNAGKEFYGALDRYDDQRRVLDRAVVTADALDDAEAAVEDADRAHGSAITQHQGLGREIARLERARRTRPALGKIEALHRELAAFRDLPEVVPSHLAAWRRALETDHDLARELSRLDAADAADAAMAANRHVDTRVLAAGGTIDRLRERLGAVNDAISDLPRRTEAKAAAERRLTEAAHRLGVASAQALLAGLPNELALAHLDTLIRAGERVEQRCRDAEEQHRRAVADLGRLADTRGEPAPTIDPEPLRKRMAVFVRLPADAERLRRAVVDQARSRQHLADQVAKLDPPAGRLEDLAACPLPDDAAIAPHLRVAVDLAQAELAGRATLAAAHEAVERADDDLATLEREGSTATRSDLADARIRRDAGFDALSVALDEGAAERSRRLFDVSALIQAVDGIADDLLDHGERAARRQAIEERLTQARRQHSRESSRLGDIAAKRQAADAAWRELWRASGIEPLSPEAMSRWSVRVHEILLAKDQLAAQANEIAVWEAELEEARRSLVRLSLAHGIELDAEAPADLAYREIDARLGAIQSAWNEATGRRTALDLAKRTVAEKQVEVADAQQVLAAHREAWLPAVAEVGLDPATSASKAAAALRIWADVARPKHELATEVSKIDDIEKELATFDAEVAALLNAAAPDLVGQASPDVLATLTERLTEARLAFAEQERLRGAAQQRHVARRDMAARRSADVEIVGNARARLDVPDDEHFEPILERLEKRQGLVDDLAGLTHSLVEIADGLSEPDLREEQAGLDPDTVPGEIARCRQHLDHLQSEISTAFNRLELARHACDNLVAGRDAGKVAQDKAEAAAELL